MTLHRTHILLAALCVAISSHAAAAQSEPVAVTPERPTATAIRLELTERIVVDGLLDEPSWERGQPIIDFKQSEPRNGEAGTERTQVRILFSRNNLYIGARLFDSDPGGILGNQMIRDGALNADDRFMWVLDPLNDGRSGFFFEVNPAGAMGDAQLVPGTGGATAIAQNLAGSSAPIR